MASFTSPGASSSSKMKHGSTKKPRGGQQARGSLTTKPEHPITDDFAAEKLPSFADRRAKTNNKSGFNTKPSQPPAGRLAQTSNYAKDRCAAGRTVGCDEHTGDANTEGHGGTQQGYDRNA